MDFKKFKAKHYNILESSNRRYIPKYWYPYEFRININNDIDIFIIDILNAIAFDWYDRKTVKQIKWVEKCYHILCIVPC